MDLTYNDAIEKVLLNNGYFAPLKTIYKEIWKYKDKSKVKGLTPDATIQKQVQVENRFTKIGKGIYALTEHLDKLENSKNDFLKNEPEKVRHHATIQGMLLEIGNERHEIKDTYTNDKKWVFENKTLGSLATLKDVPLFTYENIIKDSVTYADVIWFNERGFPSQIFEVEHSTDFRDALIKFTELQDFNTNFYCVSNIDREIKFLKEVNKSAFHSISDRVNFLSYEQIEENYKKAKTPNFIL